MWVGEIPYVGKYIWGREVGSDWHKNRIWEELPKSFFHLMLFFTLDFEHKMQKKPRGCCGKEEPMESLIKKKYISLTLKDRQELRLIFNNSPRQPSGCTEGWHGISHLIFGAGYRCRVRFLKTQVEEYRRVGYMLRPLRTVPYTPAFSLMPSANTKVYYPQGKCNFKIHTVCGGRHRNRPIPLRCCHCRKVL